MQLLTHRVYNVTVKVGIGLLNMKYVVIVNQKHFLFACNMLYFRIVVRSYYYHFQPS